MLQRGTDAACQHLQTETRWRCRSGNLVSRPLGNTPQVEHVSVRAVESSGLRAAGLVFCSASGVWLSTALGDRTRSVLRICCATCQNTTSFLELRTTYRYDPEFAVTSTQ